MTPVLVVDDNPEVLSALSLLLEIQDYSVLTANNPSTALEIQQSALQKGEPLGLIIQDMNYSPEETDGSAGQTLFYAFRENQPDVPIILMTAWANLTMAVSLVKAGAADYIDKPWDDDRLLITLRNLLDLSQQSQQAQQTQQQLNEFKQPLNSDFEQHNLCGTLFASPSMHRLIDMALQVASADVPILITGPNGAGKEKIAEIVQANSRRADKPFIRVNAGALPDDLLEAELFGAEKGAYTGCTQTRIGRFEAADGGTLFLDEMGNLPLSGQQKLLRVLQTGEFERLGSSKTQRVDVRIISATNANLPKAITEGSFREDLYYRLNVIELKIPPLSERPQDIPLLADYFLRDNAAIHNQRMGIQTSTPTLMPDALRMLCQHTWPGNVRELQNCIQRASLLCKENLITRDDLGLITPNLNNSATTPRADEQHQKQIIDGDLEHTNTGIEPSFNESSPVKAADLSIETIRSTLNHYDGVVAHAAKALGISRQALYRRLKQAK